ncbi:HD domain-containing protein [Scopulibacillus cellulosilyticus]|uniref:HD domain-containing protein n=1 Tax=Scopulibacillus cellulosilyticus TaxID=2665665 RepID=A0ABW2PPR8_9BACL
MNQQKIIDNAKEFVYQQLKDDPSGHDWWHIHRVSQNAKRIATAEKADLFICELAALLHDIADEKLNKNEEYGLKKVHHWLIDNHVNEDTRNHVIDIISTMSFKGGGRPPMKTLEGKVVQDADRLDAIGAIGIARTFAYAGAKEQLIYDPALSPRTNMTNEEYRSGNSTAINHFYEKLLKLKDLMNTDYGRKMAAERHRFMENFLNQFFKEWDEV